MEPLLAVACRITTPAGWLALDDPDNGYELHADTRAEYSKTRRTKSATGDWVAGEFAHRSVAGNVIEQLAVWIDGEDSQYLFRTRLETIEDAFDQLAYQVELTIGDLKETWTVRMPAEYRVVTQREFLHATTGYITAQVPRLPAVTLARAI